jgi:hypothetical protein
VTFGRRHDVDHLVRLEDARDRHDLLEQRVRPVDLLGDRAAVDLDLHDVRFALREAHLLDVGVRNDAHDAAVLFDAQQLAVDRFLAVGIELRVARERLALGAVPVLVEAAQELLVQVLRPHGRQRSQALWRRHVADDAGNEHRRALENRHSLNSDDANISARRPSITVSCFFNIYIYI